MACARVVVLSLSLAGVAVAQPQQQRARVDLVIAVDVSGSMRGLIDGTRMKLWEAVRLLGRAKPMPTVRVGLISYGGKFADPRAGYVRKELDLTTDLDAVSQKLFALQIRGSQEYVARTVQTATRQMAWDQDPSTLKILFVAGNESAEQDPLVTLTEALGEARQRGILVNAIFCGQEGAREALAWRRVAAMGGGEFAAIDHNRSVLAAESPYDGELTRLSTALSATYVGYGAGGIERRQRQHAEDERAKRDGVQVAADRAAAKATPTYSNADWDVVDAYAAKKMPAPSMLPAEVAALPEAGRDKWLREKVEQRKDIREKIGALATRREIWFGGDSVAGRPAGPLQPAAPASAPVAASAPPLSMPAPMAKPKHAAQPATMSDAFSGAIQRNAVKNGYSF